MYKYVKNEKGRTIVETLEITGAVTTIVSSIVALFFVIKENKKSKKSK